MRTNPAGPNSILVTLVFAVAFTAVGLAQEGAQAATGEAPAEEPVVDIPYATQVETFFDHLSRGEGGEAIDDLYRSNPWRSGIADQLDKLREQFAAFSAERERLLGFDVVREQELGPRFVYVWTVAYFDRQPIQFHFIFYRPKEAWRIYQFSYDQETSQIVKQLAREALATREGAR